MYRLYAYNFFCKKMCSMAVMFGRSDVHSFTGASATSERLNIKESRSVAFWELPSSATKIDHHRPFI